MEIREPRYKVGDKVYCKQYESSAIITGVSDYSFNKDKYFYNVEWECGDYLDEISEYLLESYIEKPNSIWELQNGDTYYAIDYSEMTVHSIEFCNDEYDLNNRELRNCFLTKEEAEFALERIKIEAEMLTLGGRRKFKNNRDNCGIYHIDDSIYAKSYRYVIIQGLIYFDSIKEAEDAIKKIGEDRIKKYIFGVEE